MRGVLDDKGTAFMQKEVYTNRDLICSPKMEGNTNRIRI